MNKRATIRLLALLLVLSLAAWGVHLQVASARIGEARSPGLQTTPRPTLAPTETVTPTPTATSAPTPAATATSAPTAPPSTPAAPAATPTASPAIMLPEAGGS